MSDRQCPSCGGFCSKVGCERQNVCKLPVPLIKNTHESEIYGAGFAAGAASRDAEIEALRADAARIKTSARLLDDVVSEKFPIGQTDYQQEIAMIPPSVWVKVKKLAAEILRAAIAAEATK